jgi:hypothetical protein
MTVIRFGTVALLAMPFAAGAAQTPVADPADVASPEAIVAATYAAIGRAPGERYDWHRFRSLFLPTAHLIPNTEQTGGEERVLTVDGFIAWIEGVTTIGGPSDQGFQEEGIALAIDRYGDIAQAFSTYRKHFWEQEQTLGLGINSFQLVRRSGRWWIAGIVWDEEASGEAIPERYLPDGG